MGSSSSKHTAAPPSSLPLSSSGTYVPENRSIIRTIWKSSSPGSHHSRNDDPQVFSCRSEENVSAVSRSNENVSAIFCKKNKAEQRNESSLTDRVSRETNNSSRAFSSCFSFSPKNLSFRLTRAKSVGTRRIDPASSSSCIGFTDNNELAISDATTRNDRSQGCEFFPACFTNRFLRLRHDDRANIIQLSSDFQGNLPENSDHDAERIMNGTTVDCCPHLPFPDYNSEIRHINRHVGAREPTEPNVRFSRTLSVGRLRDRVLRRTAVHELDLHQFQQGAEARHSSGTRGFRHSTVEATPEDDNFSAQIFSNDATSSIYNPFYESPPVRETRYRNLLEHRSNFLDRRRRIRSQVRALQRLESRFENISGHERSCLSFGQNHAGHCTCRTIGRGVYSNDGPTAGDSISRIVMLADALFEVLDEIQQQTVVVLTEQPSASSVGSFPAPNEVIDALPLKIFGSSKKKLNEEAAQCYICLVEYEEGESMRILPCHHDFHSACVDKWLKEVHRICPLCRGDVCRPEASTGDS